MPTECQLSLCDIYASVEELLAEWQSGIVEGEITDEQVRENTKKWSVQVRFRGTKGLTSFGRHAKAT